MADQYELLVEAAWMLRPSEMSAVFTGSKGVLCDISCSVIALQQVRGNANYARWLGSSRC